MNATSENLRVASRPSPLALAQTRSVTELMGLEESAILPVENQSEAADKGRFVHGVEAELLAGRAELAVHSAKDLPGETTPGLVIAAVPPDADPREAWIGPGDSIDQIPEGTRVGTSSRRRRAQLKILRPDLELVEMSGNVDTRLAKLEAGQVDALVLAVAGLKRLGRDSEVAFVFSCGQITPAAGQGKLVVQARADGPGISAARQIDDEGCHGKLIAERAAVTAIGADCESPVGFRARFADGQLSLEGFAGLTDGSVWLRDRVLGDPGQPLELGRELATRMLGAGAGEILTGTGAS